MGFRLLEPGQLGKRVLEPGELVLGLLERGQLGSRFLGPVGGIAPLGR